MKTGAPSGDGVFVQFESLQILVLNQLVSKSSQWCLEALQVWTKSELYLQMFEIEIFRYLTMIKNVYSTFSHLTIK